MSYDLMVFNKDAAPLSKAEFMQWYDVQTDWEEGRNYTDLSICTTDLKNWYHDIINEFPPLIDELVDEHIVVPEKLTEYVLGGDIIYCAFSWAFSEEAYTLCFALAKKHNLGFFDVSSDDGTVFINGRSI